MKSLIKKQKGFTLIEIVLVLAIAAFIILMVFLALSGANKARRDTQRKQNAGQVTSDLEAYASNNNGAYPNNSTTLATFAGQYVTAANNLTDPSTGAVYTLTYGTTQPTAVGNMVYSLGQTCNGNAMTTGAANQYALMVALEVGGDACYHN